MANGCGDLFTLLMLLRVWPAMAHQSVQLLVLVPFFDPQKDVGWDRGIELLPAARLARNEINQRKDLLPGYHLELIEAGSNACGVPIPYNATLNFVNHAIGLYGNPTVFGVTGLVCSTITKAISPIAGHPGLEMVQLSIWQRLRNWPIRQYILTCREFCPRR